MSAALISSCREGSAVCAEVTQRSLNRAGQKACYRGSFDSASAACSGSDLCDPHYNNLASLQYRRHAVYANVLLTTGCGCESLDLSLQTLLLFRHMPQWC